MTADYMRSVTFQVLSSAVKMEATGSSEMLTGIHGATYRKTIDLIHLNQFTVLCMS
jgi:hypothetical protein